MTTIKTKTDEQPCPRCGNKEKHEIEHKGKKYSQCSKCHFWSTKPWYLNVGSAT